MMLDPLSDLVELADAQCGLSGAVLGSGEWAAELQSPGSLKFFVMRQTCWFTIEHESALRVDPGDVILIRVGRSYCMESRPGVALGGQIAFVKDEFISFETYASDECIAMACFVALDDTRGHMLLDLLPASIVVRGSEPEAMGLRLLYEQLMREVRSVNAGAKLAVSKLTQLIFLQVLRAHLSVVRDGLPISNQGWLTALGDNKIAHALQAMHQQPARAWTLDELARTVSMSRTSFSKRFRLTMGDTPLNYLRHLRMAIAAKNLCDSNQTVSTIAFELGYGSEAAFSSAFKKSMKMAPKFYRENAMRRKA